MTIRVNGKNTSGISKLPVLILTIEQISKDIKVFINTILGPRIDFFILRKAINSAHNNVQLLITYSLNRKIYKPMQITAGSNPISMIEFNLTL